MKEEQMIDSRHMRNPLHCIVPPDLLYEILRTGDDEARNAVLDTLQLDHQFRLTRAESAARAGGPSAQPVTFARIGGQPQRTVYDQQHSQNQTPGKVARVEGQKPVADKSVNQAYDGLGDTYRYYWTVY